MNKYN